MEDKRRLANEQEKTLQLRQTSPLEPMSNNIVNKSIASPPLSSSNNTINSFQTLSSSSSTLNNVLNPQNFSMSPLSPMQPQQQMPKMNQQDPFASLNAFVGMSQQQQQQRTTNLSSPIVGGASRLNSPSSMSQQSWTSGSLNPNPIRPPPPPGLQKTATTTMGAMIRTTQNSMIPPPPPPGTFVKAPPSMNVSVNWNQSSVLDGSLNNFGQQKPQTGQSTKPRAQDELADLLG